MLFGGGVLGFVFLAFWVWAIFDVISSDEAMVRNVPKLVWLLLVVFLSTIGAVAWLLLGRPRPEAAVARPREVAPSTDEEARRARYAALDEELDRRLEEKRQRDPREDQ